MSETKPIAFLRTLYDVACLEFDAVFAREDPCNIHEDEDGRITCAGDYKDDEGLCCGSWGDKGGQCVHLGPQGCTVQSVSCKSWICSHLFAARPDVRRELLALSDKYEKLGLFVEAGYRLSKEEFFERLGRKIPAAVLKRVEAHLASREDGQQPTDGMVHLVQEDRPPTPHEDT